MRGRRHPSEGVSTACVDFHKCPAKTYQRDDGSVVPGRSVIEHCQIVGNVATALIDRYPKELRNALFPSDVPFAAACHDIGKVSPCFLEKLRRACTAQADDLPTLSVNPELERGWGGHAGVSQVAAKAMEAPQWLPEILGQHHGYLPPIDGKRADAEVFGGSAWQGQRVALVEELKQRLKMDWPHLKSIHQARLVAGLTTVADWIGSGEHFEDPAQLWQPCIGRALDEAGFIPPDYRLGLSFEDVFGFSPRPVQSRLIDAVVKPGVYVLEAPMGMGKTEAALYASYRLLEGGHASGIYFALPTQLTSNKIYQRFNEFLQKVLAEKCEKRSLLLHANAWLVGTEMGEEGRPGGAWFNQAKRGLLAPFAVGTIDQALMAAMNVKHGFVRAFGLAGKVVVLDEVHSYDAYTGTLLDALVDLLSNLHCTVIILSATLNRQRRSQLLHNELHSDAYPLVTVTVHGQPAQELPVAAKVTATVKVTLQRDDHAAVQQALDRAAAGQQVIWIENTVNEAQQRYLALASRAAELGVECGLLHSRFSMVDRQRNEDRWVDLFGKAGWPTRSKCGRILVGTQVLEQSLDIDSDFLITRFAPTDMLLQRLGRLWRHAETPRAYGSSCEALFLAPDLSQAIESPMAAFGSSAHVYSPYVMCRSLEVWQARSEVVLPHDIRSMIELTYGERDEQGAMFRWRYELEEGTPRRKGRNALRQLARIGLAGNGKTKPESQAQTRYSESDSFELLLLRDAKQIQNEQVSRLCLLNGCEIRLPWGRNKMNKKQWKKTTATLMQQIVPVRASEAPTPVDRSTLEKYGLHHCFYLGDRNWIEDESLLRVALVDEAGILRSLHGGRAHDNFILEYRDDLGYRLIKE